MRNGETGLLYESGNAEDLREKLLYMIGNPNREAFLKKFTLEQNYQILMEIYEKVISLTLNLSEYSLFSDGFDRRHIY